MLKRVIDIIFSLCFLVISCPLLLIVSIFIKLNLGSPVIFRPQRPGLNEKIFTIYKFRTMSDAKDKKGQLLADKDRLTRLGKWLRKTSLDELPQFWNILKGEMSLVGPRALLVEYLPRYNQEQRKRHWVKPGITGWAQINGRNAISWEERFKLDVWYVEQYTFWLDIKILLLTVKTIFIKDGVNFTNNTTTDYFIGSDHEINKK